MGKDNNVVRTADDMCFLCDGDNHGDRGLHDDMGVMGYGKYKYYVLHKM